MTSRLYDKVYGCLLGGLIGDAMGRPVEGKTFQQIEDEYGEVSSFAGGGTDDSDLKHVLCQAIKESGGYPGADDWALEFLKRKTPHGFYTPVANAFEKMRGQDVPPRQAGHGNMASSSSAMCISPIGIINAGNPRQAALETFEAASWIHHNFCREAACVMAAAVAACFTSGSVDEVIASALQVLPVISGRIMNRAIRSTLDLAEQCDEYKKFRQRYYDELMLPAVVISDSRETVPVALAVLRLAAGDPKQTIIYGVNFGRDADTIASMAGALAGALRGAHAFPAEWIARIEAAVSPSQADLATELVQVVLKRADAMHALIRAIGELANDETLWQE